MASTHANRGKTWENDLNRLHALYASQAVVIRNHPEVAVRRRGKQIVGATFRATGAPDYTLITRAGTILADAKHINEPRWPLRLLEGHQAGTLWAVEKVNGLGLLLVETTAGRWALPWSVVAPLWGQWSAGMAKRGQASLTPAQMTEMAICASPIGVALDYLPAAMELLAARHRRAA